MTDAPIRTAIVGTGHRAQTFTEALAARPGYRVVALCDLNPTRMDVHNRLLTGAGRPAAACFPPDQFGAMLRDERPELVVVCTVDATHHTYIVAALRAGARVITEKPMSTDADKAGQILQAVAETGGDLSVAFNYRFSPVHLQVRQLLEQGAIGDVLSVHFEWCLDVRHGADYFRRWHRDKSNSGGLMVHKAGHHFDLVNWWLGAAPRTVYGQGRLAFYGPVNGGRRGYARGYLRAHGADAASDDPFAIHLSDNPTLQALYLDAERHDGYRRDVNVFSDGITIEDDMAVLVGYDTGATMSYHLTAYSPFEGYRVMFNGSAGRLELDVEESAWARPRTKVEPGAPVIHGGLAATPAEGHSRITVRALWAPPVEVDAPHEDAMHGGGDIRMLAALLDGAPSQAADRATAYDGAAALVTGLAANQSFVTGRPVQTDSVLSLGSRSPERVR